MIQFSPENHPHRRYNPLTEEWILVSPQRTKRPWQGQLEKADAPRSGPYDPTCYLCPGNLRSGGTTNPPYDDVFIFDNDFSALTEDTPNYKAGHPLLQMKSESGLCRVVCFSSRHDLTIPQLSVQEIRKVIDAWINEYKRLGAMKNINHVQIFENKGSIMGCSNPHPHGQIWAQQSIPNESLKKLNSQKAYWDSNHSSLLGDYLEEELKQRTRIIFENDTFIGLVPFWAAWPFETMLIPRRQISRIDELSEDEKNDFADAYKNITTVYDSLFATSFPYSAGVHQAPTDGDRHDYGRLHMSFYPPLLRSASIRKFMVGYEMFADPQRDITPEGAALLLRAAKS